MSDEIVDYDPQDYPEAIQWFKEARARHRRSRERITILETTNANLHSHIRELEHDKANMHMLNDTLREAVAELEDELAALRARRCETCLHTGDISKSGTPCRVCKRIWGWVPLSSGCDEWEARA